MGNSAAGSRVGDTVAPSSPTGSGDGRGVTLRIVNHTGLEFHRSSVEPSQPEKLQEAWPTNVGAARCCYLPFLGESDGVSEILVIYHATLKHASTSRSEETIMGKKGRRVATKIDLRDGSTDHHFSLFVSVNKGIFGLGGGLTLAASCERSPSTFSSLRKVASSAGEAGCCSWTVIDTTSADTAAYSAVVEVSKTDNQVIRNRKNLLDAVEARSKADGSQLRFSSDFAGRCLDVSSDCLSASHADPSGSNSLWGVAFVRTPLPRSSKGEAYFEMRIDATKQGGEDGMAVGVTLTAPGPPHVQPQVADEWPKSWLLGYDGHASSPSLTGGAIIRWKPQDLRVGDRVGVLVNMRGEVWVFQNGQPMDKAPGDAVPYSADVFGIVDLVGATKAVSILPGARPPPLAYSTNVARTSSDVPSAQSPQGLDIPPQTAKSLGSQSATDVIARSTAETTHGGKPESQLVPPGDPQPLADEGCAVVRTAPAQQSERDPTYVVSQHGLNANCTGNTSTHGTITSPTGVDVATTSPEGHGDGVEETQANSPVADMRNAQSAICRQSTQNAITSLEESEGPSYIESLCCGRIPSADSACTASAFPPPVPSLRHGSHLGFADQEQQSSSHERGISKTLIRSQEVSVAGDVGCGAAADSIDAASSAGAAFAGEAHEARDTDETTAAIPTAAAVASVADDDDVADRTAAAAAAPAAAPAPAPASSSALAPAPALALAPAPALAPASAVAAVVAVDSRDAQLASIDQSQQRNVETAEPPITSGLLERGIGEFWPAAQLAVFRRILQNVVDHPTDHKYRCLPLGNPRIKDMIATAPESLPALRCLGWEDVIEEGTPVVVVSSFESDSDVPVQLDAKLEGKVLEIDRDGDAMISFEGIFIVQMVFEKHFCKLMAKAEPGASMKLPIGADLEALRIALRELPASPSIVAQPTAKSRSGALAIKNRAAIEKKRQDEQQAAEQQRQAELANQEFESTYSHIIASQDLEFQTSLLRDQMKDLLTERDALTETVSRLREVLQTAQHTRQNADLRLSRYGENPRIRAESEAAREAEELSKVQFEEAASRLEEVEASISEKSELLTVAAFANS